jgi:tRNA threonylcarbamoyl adenosine modification protein YeaZ
MNVLAFDACLGAVSAAVRRRGPEGELLREAYELRAAGHAERLMPMIAEVMEGAGLDFSALDRIAVTLGPGGFTGVRIGIAAARGLALATGKPVVAATSLAVMAHRAEALLAEAGEPLGARRLMVAADARRGALYVQGFTAGTVETAEARLLTPPEAVRSLGSEGAVVVGSGAAAVAAAAEEAGVVVEARFPDLQPHARSLAALSGRLAPVSPVRPLYLRPPDVRPQEAAMPARAPA